MYQLFYDFITQEALLGGAMEQESAQILAQYLSYAFVVGVVLCLFGIVKWCFNWVSKW